MPLSESARAARWLLFEIRQGPSIATTERVLKDSAGGLYDRMAVEMGLRWLKRRGWAMKQDHPAAKHRPDLGAGWELTDAGLAELERRITRQVEYEKTQQDR